ncbi:hypothetical protein Tdes44962_MAKER08105 [Teratosphaeria destructans]|uniref:Uncharacterized protein n=1 Tax=Teratosphaeria destructans TaxID=418781 RepID=A0A9W7SXM6_9PEZI|nr:hypothetical protein Tdes44962_MAKER08105 [Teratosphaeria destructans]
MEHVGEGAGGWLVVLDHALGDRVPVAETGDFLVEFLGQRDAQGQQLFRVSLPLRRGTHHRRGRCGWGCGAPSQVFHTADAGSSHDGVIPSGTSCTDQTVQSGDLVLGALLVAFVVQLSAVQVAQVALDGGLVPGAGLVVLALQRGVAHVDGAELAPERPRRLPLARHLVCLDT